MPRDNRAGSSSRCSAAREPMFSRCTLTTTKSHRTIDPDALKNPRPAGAESTLTENVASPFHAEPRDQDVGDLRRLKTLERRQSLKAMSYRISMRIIEGFKALPRRLIAEYQRRVLVFKEELISLALNPANMILPEEAVCDRINVIQPN